MSKRVNVSLSNEAGLMWSRLIQSGMNMSRRVDQLVKWLYEAEYGPDNPDPLAEMIRQEEAAVVAMEGDVIKSKRRIEYLQERYHSERRTDQLNQAALNREDLTHRNLLASLVNEYSDWEAGGSEWSDVSDSMSSWSDTIQGRARVGSEWGRMADGMRLPVPATIEEARTWLAEYQVREDVFEELKASPDHTV